MTDKFTQKTMEAIQTAHRIAIENQNMQIMLGHNLHILIFNCN